METDYNSNYDSFNSNNNNNFQPSKENTLPIDLTSTKKNHVINDSFFCNLINALKTLKEKKKLSEHELTVFSIFYENYNRLPEILKRNQTFKKLNGIRTIKHRIFNGKNVNEFTLIFPFNRNDLNSNNYKKIIKQNLFNPILNPTEKIVKIKILLKTFLLHAYKEDLQIKKDNNETIFSKSIIPSLFIRLKHNEAKKKTIWSDQLLLSRFPENFGNEFERSSKSIFVWEILKTLYKSFSVNDANECFKTIFTDFLSLHRIIQNENIIQPYIMKFRKSKYYQPYIKLLALSLEKILSSRRLSEITNTIYSQIEIKENNKISLESYQKEIISPFYKSIFLSEILLYLFRKLQKKTKKNNLNTSISNFEAFAPLIDQIEKNFKLIEKGKLEKYRAINQTKNDFNNKLNEAIDELKSSYQIISEIIKNTSSQITLCEKEELETELPPLSLEELNNILDSHKNSPHYLNPLLKKIKKMRKLINQDVNLKKFWCNYFIDNQLSWKFSSPITQEAQSSFRTFFTPLLEKKLKPNNQLEFATLFPLEIINGPTLIPKIYNELHTLAGKNPQEVWKSIEKAISSTNLLKVFDEKIRTEISYTFLDYKLQEIENFTFPNVDKAIKTIIIISQNINGAKLFIFTGIFFKGLLQGIFQYQETNKSKEFFNDKVNVNEPAYDYTFDELKELQNKIRSDLKLLETFLILEGKKPKFENAEENVDIINANQTSPEKHNSSDTLKRKIQENSAKARKKICLTTNKNEGNENLEQETEAFKALELKKPSTEEIIEEESDEIELPLGLDFSATLSFLNLSTVCHKIEKQKNIFKGILKSEPLQISGPNFKFRSSINHFIHYVEDLKDYQEKEIQYLCNFYAVNGYFPLLSWGMGVGKTLVIFALVFHWISLGNKNFKILEPKSSVNEIKNKFLKELFKAKLFVLRNAKAKIDPELQIEIDNIFNTELFIPLDKTQHFESLFPLIHLYYVYNEQKNSLFWKILSNDYWKNQLFTYILEKIKENLQPIYNTGEGRKIILSVAGGLSRELVHLDFSFDLGSFETFFESCEELAHTKIQTNQSVNLHLILFALMKLSHIQLGFNPTLDWDLFSKQKHLNILKFPLKNILGIAETKDYENIKMDKDGSHVIIGGHETENHEKAAYLTYDLTVYDEAQKYHNEQTKGYKLINENRQNKKIKNIFLVSATPLENGFEELLQLIKLTCPHFLKNKEIERILQIALLNTRKTIFAVSQNKIEEEKELKLSKLINCVINTYMDLLFLAIKAQELVLLKKMNDQDVKQSWKEIPTPYYDKINGSLSPLANETVKSIENKDSSLLARLAELQKTFVHPNLAQLKKNLWKDELKNLVSSGKLFNESPLITSLQQNTIFQEKILKEKNKCAFIVDKYVTAEALEYYFSSLAKQGIKIKLWKITGNNSAEERNITIKQFKIATSSEFIPVLLLTSAGGTSLNIPGVEYVFKMQLSYNPFAEEQADYRFIRVNGVLETKVSSVFFYKLHFNTLAEKHHDAIQMNKRLWYDFFFFSNEQNLHGKLKQIIASNNTNPQEKIEKMKILIPNLYFHFKKIWCGILKTENLRDALIKGGANSVLEPQRVEAEKIIDSLFNGVNKDCITEDQLYNHFLKYIESEMELNKNNPPMELEIKEEKKEMEIEPTPPKTVTIINKPEQNSILIPTHHFKPPSARPSKQTLPLPPVNSANNNVSSMPFGAINTIIPKEKLKISKFYLAKVANREEGELLGMVIRKSDANNPHIKKLISPGTNSEYENAKQQLLAEGKQQIGNKLLLKSDFDFLLFTNEVTHYITHDLAVKKDKVRILFMNNLYYVMIFKGNTR